MEFQKRTKISLPLNSFPRSHPILQSPSMASRIPSHSSDEDPDYQVGAVEETESEEENEVEASDGASLSDGSSPVEILRNGEHGVEGGDGQGEESSSSSEEVNGPEIGRGGGVGVCAGPSGFGNPNGEVLNCPICFEPWTPEGPHRVCCIPCGHVFGRSCLEKWVQRCGKNTGKCPICNRKFNEKEIINLYAPLIAVRNDELEKEVRTLREKNKLLQYERRIQELRETQASSQTGCSIDHILTEVMGDSKGNSMYGLEQHYRTAIYTFAGRYIQEHINNILSQNQMLQESAWRYEWERNCPNILEEFQRTSEVLQRTNEVLRRTREELQRTRDELRRITDVLLMTRLNYVTLSQFVVGECPRFLNPQTDHPSDETSGGSRPGGPR